MWKAQLRRFLRLFVLIHSCLYAAQFPIIIHSDMLEIDDELKLIVFKGNVIATKGDLKISCNRMKVYYAKEGSVKKIVAIGDVKIYRGEGMAMANKAEYYQKEEKIILTGKPVVKKGKDFVEGERIIIYLKQNRSIVESSEKRQVKAVIFPKEKR